MILTITPNPALDLTWRVDALVPGATHRVPTGSSRAGGKGLNVARVLHNQGHDVLALATVGGPTGAEFETDLTTSGIPHRVIPVSAPTRRTVAVVDDGRRETSILNEPGAKLGEAEVSAMLEEASRLGRSARAVTISGSLPPGFGDDHLERLVRELVTRGIPVVADTSGPALLAAARAGADALKPNREELESATGHADPLDGANALLSLGARLVVVSLGAEGLVVVTRDRPPVRAQLPRTLHGNPTGAGDAAVAAIAVELAERGPAASEALEALARRAAAWSASAVLMPLAGDLSDHTAALADEMLVTTMKDLP